jgi:hypothetical protein
MVSCAFPFRGNGYCDVDDRFRPESGDGGNSHVLDIENVAPDLFMQHTPFLLGETGPIRTVRDNLYRASFQADHAASLEPTCRDSPKIIPC